MNIKLFKNTVRLISTSAAIALTTMSLKVAIAQESLSLVPEIGWNSRLSSLGLDEAENIGQSYTFYCQKAPKDLIFEPIWGTGVYTLNSGICTAAVHAGVITKEGGKVTVELANRQPFFTGSLRNQIDSEDHRAMDMSFVFIDTPEGQNVTNLITKPTPNHNNTSEIERVLVNGIQRGVEKSIENVFRDIFR